MEAIKMVISAMTAWMAVVCLFGGVFIGALALVRLGYSVVVERARVFGTVIFGQYRILSPLFLLLI